MILKYFTTLTALISITCSVYASDNELVFNTQSFSPFTYESDGMVSGPAADIIREVCREMDTKCTLKLLPWARAQHEVKKGQANAMFVIGKNRQRETWLYFTPPVFDTEYGLFVNNSNPLNYTGVNDIKGYTVGVYGPSNTSHSLKTLQTRSSDLTIDMTPHDESAFRKLSVGRVDCVYSNKTRGMELINSLGLKNIRYAGRHRSLQYYFGFSKEFTAKSTVDRFNQILTRLYTSGRIHSLLKPYPIKPAVIQ